MPNIRSSLVAAMLLTFLANVSLFANSATEGNDCLCPTVSGLTTSSTATTLTISWTANPDYMHTIVNVVKGNGSNPTIYFRTTTTGNSVTIVGTSPATQYTATVSGVCNDGQSATSPATVTVTTVSASPVCGSGANDIGGSIFNPTPIFGAFSDQMESENEVDAYNFFIECPGTTTVVLNSMLNDYELQVSGTDANGVLVFSAPIVSKNGGTTNESITFTLDQTVTYPVTMLAVVYTFGTAYNTHDCYTITPSPPNCFTGGGGEGNLIGGAPVMQARSNMNSGGLELMFDRAFEKEENIQVQVIAADGRVLMQETTQAFRGDTQLNLQLPVLNDGVYFVNARGSFGQASRKLVFIR
ncbi:MAG: T9SS type A sorting domain-containing protein [Saprospiraceae bacterium]|nr:T9SS type A sorting domain-containing protein [Saprospiraceae bacterium]